MSIIVVSSLIDAPLDAVFGVVSDPQKYADIVPHIIGIRFLTAQDRGLGVRFSETRLVRGQEFRSELEVTEFIDHEKIRLISDDGGTKWVSNIYTVAKDEGCELRIEMEANAYRLPAMIMNFLCRGLIRKEISKDLDAIKHYCEANHRSG